LFASDRTTRRGSGRALVWCATLLLAGCSRGDANPPATNAATSPVESGAARNDFVVPEDARGVRTAAAQAQRLPDYVDVAGRVQADPTRVVRVYPPVGGRLVSVDIRPADRVAQGQVLAVLASSDVAAARAAYRQAQADAHVKQQGVERSRLLYEHSVIALRDYQQAQADAAIASAALESATERLALLDVDTTSSSDQLAVRAPRAGVVTDVGAAPGEYAKSLDNANPLCIIADLTTIWVVGDVYEKDLASLRVGDWADILVSAYPGEPWKGRISAISNTVDTTTRSVKIRLVLANGALRLKPDMFATIRVLRAVRSVPVVPQTAILREGTSAYLFVQTSPGHFERRLVTLGRDINPSQVEVTSGLAPGETVLIEGAELLRAAATPS
jgi:membrane fusion protein, heavy metal efflux system